MAHVVVLGAGLGGTIMAYELRDALGRGHRISVVNKGPRYSFVPSNPWVAVGWRDRNAVEVELAPVFLKRAIDFYPQGAARLDPASKSMARRGAALSSDTGLCSSGTVRTQNQVLSGNTAINKKAQRKPVRSAGSGPA